MAADYWRSSQCHNWQFTHEQLTFARQEDARYASSLELAAIGIWIGNTLSNLCKRLGLRQRVTATSTVFARRFYAKNSYSATDPCMVCAGCVYVAAKVEEMPIHVKTVVQEAMRMFAEISVGKFQFPSDRAVLAEMEFYLIEDLEFDLIVHHPYRALVSIYDAIGNDSKKQQAAQAAAASQQQQQNLRDGLVSPDSPFSEALFQPISAPSVSAHGTKHTTSHVGGIHAQGGGGGPDEAPTVGPGGAGIGAPGPGPGPGSVIGGIEGLGIRGSMIGPGEWATRGVVADAVAMALQQDLKPGSVGKIPYKLDIFDDRVFQMAWPILNDVYRTNIPLLYPPYLIALAAICLALVVQEEAFQKLQAGQISLDLTFTPRDPGSVEPSKSSNEGSQGEHLRATSNTTAGPTAAMAGPGMGGPGAPAPSAATVAPAEIGTVGPGAGAGGHQGGGGGGAGGQSSNLAFSSSSAPISIDRIKHLERDGKEMVEEMEESRRRRIELEAQNGTKEEGAEPDGSSSNKRRKLEGIPSSALPRLQTGQQQHPAQSNRSSGAIANPVGSGSIRLPFSPGATGSPALGGAYGTPGGSVGAPGPSGTSLSSSSSSAPIRRPIIHGLPPRPGHLPQRPDLRAPPPPSSSASGPPPSSTAAAGGYRGVGGTGEYGVTGLGMSLSMSNSGVGRGTGADRTTPGPGIVHSPGIMTPGHQTSSQHYIHPRTGAAAAANATSSQAQVQTASHHHPLNTNLMGLPTDPPPHPAILFFASLNCSIPVLAEIVQEMVSAYEVWHACKALVDDGRGMLGLLEGMREKRRVAILTAAAAAATAAGQASGNATTAGGNAGGGAGGLKRARGGAE
ncbi:RNA polymerase II holoenzyme cyclin-like subunit [Tilletia horrida]|nr:RNA polymerase II holoenzyme cyclin-like subunit [Tilletia horrida]